VRAGGWIEFGRSATDWAGRRARGATRDSVPVRIGLSWLADRDSSGLRGHNWVSDSGTLTLTGVAPGDLRVLTPDEHGRWSSCGIPAPGMIRVVALDPGGRVCDVVYARVAASGPVVNVGPAGARGR
jgi:hypothetical protein